MHIFYLHGSNDDHFSLDIWISAIFELLTLSVHRVRTTFRVTDLRSTYVNEWINRYIADYI